jgi:hypothetical protein
VPTSRAYIGIHKGLITDEYNHSSTCEEFGDLLRTEFHNFKYEVLDTGSLGAMLNKEHKMLKEVNAISNPNYFNKSNGSPASTEFDETRGLKLVAKIKKMSGKQEDATIIAKSIFIQVRMADIPNHVQDIRSAIDEVHGNTSHPELNLKAVLLEGYYEEEDEDFNVDGSLGIGGNHSTKATVSSKHGKTIETIRVPREDWIGMTDTDIMFVGMQLNKQKGKVQPKHNAVDDLVKFALELYYNRNIDVESDEMFKKLQTFDVPKRQINSAIGKTRRLVEMNELNATGQKIRDWTTGEDKTNLQEIMIPNLSNDETYVETISSGSGGSVEKFGRNLVAQEKLGRKFKKAIMIVRHPSVSYYLDWKNSQKMIDSRRFIQWAMDHAKIELVEMNLPHLQDQMAAPEANLSDFGFE